MLKAKDFRQIAREGLKGNWLKAVGAGVITALLGGRINTIGGGGGSSTAGTGGEEATVEAIMADPTFGTITMAVFGAIMIFVVVYALVTLVIGGALSFGYAKFNLNLVNKTNPDIKDIFSEMGRFKTGFVMQFLKFIYVLLWSLLFIIPGIIASYSYRMTPYILMENPDMTANQAIAASKELMKGNKWRLVCLEFSFIGWSILSAITLGVGYLFLSPYMEAAGAAFYREIKWERNKQQVGM